MENITRDKEGIHSEYEIKVMLGNLRQNWPEERNCQNITL